MRKGEEEALAEKMMRPRACRHASIVVVVVVVWIVLWKLVRFTMIKQMTTEWRRHRGRQGRYDIYVCEFFVSPAWHPSIDLATPRAQISRRRRPPPIPYPVHTNHPRATTRRSYYVGIGSLRPIVQGSRLVGSIDRPREEVFFAHLVITTQQDTTSCALSTSI